MVRIPVGGLPGGKLAVLAAGVVLVGAAGLIGVAVIDEDDEQASSATTTTAVATPTTVATTSLTTTAPPTTTGVTPSSSTSAPTTTRAPATSTTTPPPTTTVAGTRCGSGRASVTFIAKDLVTDALSSSFTPQAVVDNQVSAPIQVEELVVEIAYPGNDVRIVRFTTAGTVIGPGTSASFTAEKITTTRRYDSARFTRFTYFTEGQPTACRVTTP